MWELETLGRFYSRNWNYLDLRVLGQGEIREREREQQVIMMYRFSKVRGGWED